MAIITVNYLAFLQERIAYYEALEAYFESVEDTVEAAEAADKKAFFEKILSESEVKNNGR